MKILLLSPATGPWKGISRRALFNGKTFRFSMLSLLTIAALSPKNSHIRIVDEQTEAIPYDEDFDVVGITFMTAVAPRAYEIAETFRRRNIKVVFGGFHTTLNPDEALEHADAIVVGSAFGAWEALLEDLRTGNLKRRYKGNPGGSVPPALPRHLVRRSDYVTVNATYATMGCANHCHFCSISAFHQGMRHHREIAEVVREVSTFRESFFMFVDDNLTQDRDYARELLKQLAPLGKKWGTQASVDVADDEELLILLRQAGCIGLFIGLETMNDEALKVQGKDCNRPLRYHEAISRIHRHGMFVEAGIVFGFDTDDRSVFRATLEELDRIGIDAIQVSVLTPLPGTPLHEELKERILDWNWEHYDYRHVVFKPKQMSPEELQAGTDWVISQFYSPLRIAKRLVRTLFMPGGWRKILYPLVLNLAYFGRLAAFGIKGCDPSGRTVQTMKPPLTAATDGHHPDTGEKGDAPMTPTSSPDFLSNSLKRLMDQEREKTFGPTEEGRNHENQDRSPPYAGNPALDLRHHLLPDPVRVRRAAHKT